MEQITITPDNLKLALKDALLEIFTEQRELLSTLIVEAIEDTGLTEAIKEGLQSEEASRDQVFQALREIQGES